MLYSAVKNCKFTVLLGTCHQRIGFTEKRILGISDDIEINRNASKVEHQYNSFGFAVCKGGVTTYELMYLGIPLLLVSTSNVQKGMLDFLDKQGGVLYIGHWDEISEDKINSKIQEICSDFSNRKRLSERAKQIIDGQGTARIVNAIEAL
jgi:spore coat polysaccharide biosynthesis predicted glycosyltransferase SpsG